MSVAVRLISRSSRWTIASEPKGRRENARVDPFDTVLRVGTRREVARELRASPGITASEIAGRLALSGVAVRRHLERLAADGLAEPVPSPRRGRGRPASGWRLTAAGIESDPRRYDRFALDLLEYLVARSGP